VRDGNIMNRVRDEGVREWEVYELGKVRGGGEIHLFEQCTQSLVFTKLLALLITWHYVRSYSVYNNSQTL